MALNAYTATGVGVAIVILLLLARWKWRNANLFGKKHKLLRVQQSARNAERQAKVLAGVGSPVQLVHKLCPHSNVVQSYEVEQKDSLDEHLDVLTRKLAEKEGRLRLSKCKIRETQHEIENLHAIDQDVRLKYRDVMEALRNDLNLNERECKKLQEQIEWVSRRRAELKEEVRRGQKMYGEAAAELASNLAELQKGRYSAGETKVVEKSHEPLVQGVRHRKEPQLPTSSPHASLTIKSPPGSPTIEVFSRPNTACI